MNVKFWPTMYGILRGFFLPEPAARPIVIAANSPGTGPQPLHVQIGCAFALNLHKEFSPDTLADIDRANRQRNDHFCASHDVCDANEYMHAAFLDVMKRDIDLQDPEDTCLWQRAWTFAKQTGFLNIVLARKE